MRVALVANQASGGGLDPQPLAALLERHGATVRVHGCEPADLERAGSEGPERVVVAGGDGTIGGAAELAGRLGVPLAVIPTGTANDFARAAGLPDDTETAAALAATGRRTRAFELGGLADGRPFVNVASAGLASVAARRAQPLKPRLGPLAYAVGALRAAATEHPLECTIRADGDEVFTGGCWQAIVSVSGHFGGGSRIDATDPDDGRLDVTVLPGGRRLGLARRAWGLRRGTIADQRHVLHARGEIVEVDLPPGTEFNVDGEIRDRGLERVTVRHRAFELVLP